VQRLLAALNGRLNLAIVPISAPPDFPVFYKLAFACSAKFGGPNRDEWVQALVAEGVDVGAGFRGFVKRGSRRCRPTGTLACSTAAAVETMVLHHPILMSSPGVIEDLALAFLKVQQGLAEIESGDG
jgi:hypothetical protein